MGLKKYILASILLIIAVVGYTFSLESGDYRIQISDQVILLPIAAWIAVPVVLLFLASLLHMFYYNFKSYLNKRSIEKDKDTLIELIKNNLSDNKITSTFKSYTFKEIGNILNQLNLTINNSDFETDNQDINTLAQKILKVNSGEYISLKEFKLPETSAIVQTNNMNKTKIDDNYCLDILKKPASYSDILVEVAFLQVLKNKSLTTIKKLLGDLKLNQNMTIELLIKDSEYQDEFAFTSIEIQDFINALTLENKDYLQIAKQYTKRMSPDQLIKLFEDLSSKNEKANEAYLYVLFEYEMIDEIREIINNSQKDEYLPYKALLDLKDNGKHYNIDNICYLK